MKKLGVLIQYECLTSLKYIGIFYAVQYAVVCLIYLIVAVSTGDLKNSGTSFLEMNSFIYAGILGTLGYYQDFKMMIQNGFTRRYMFLATISMFAFISGILSFVDTVISNVLHAVFPEYQSVFGVFYEYGAVVVNWIWLFLMYMFICSVFYLAGLTANKLKKTYTICLGTALVGLGLLITALFRYVLSPSLVQDIGRLVLRAAGFMGDGTINYLWPFLTLLLLPALLNLLSYKILLRTELRA